MSPIPPQSRSQWLKNNLLAQVLLATVLPRVRMQKATNQKPQLRRGGRNALDPSRLNKETRIFAERAPNGTMSRRWAISDCFAEIGDSEAHVATQPQEDRAEIPKIAKSREALRKSLSWQKRPKK
jgi:hypothetical protein